MDSTHSPPIPASIHGVICSVRETECWRLGNRELHSPLRTRGGIAGVHRRHATPSSPATPEITCAVARIRAAMGDTANAAREGSQIRSK